MRDQSSKYLIFILIAVIIVIVVLGFIFYPKKEVIIVPQHNNPENFQQQQNSGPAPAPQGPKPSLVLFHSTTCGYCQQMMPEWQKLKTMPIAAQVDIIDFEFGANPSEAKKNDINGFPTIKFFPKGYGTQPAITYQGDRTAEAIMNFLINGPSK